MTYKLGKQSLSRLTGVHPSLIAIVEKVISLQIMDFSVIEGLRTIKRQTDLFNGGSSKTMNSMHMVQPDGYGHAVDLYPHPIDMLKVNKGDAKEIARFALLAGIMLSTAKSLGFELTWGGDWDRDGETLDHSFFDGPHFELTQKGK